MLSCCPMMMDDENDNLPSSPRAKALGVDSMIPVSSSGSGGAMMEAAAAPARRDHDTTTTNPPPRHHASSTGMSRRHRSTTLAPQTPERPTTLQSPSTPQRNSHATNTTATTTTTLQSPFRSPSASLGTNTSMSLSLSSCRKVSVVLRIALAPGESLFDDDEMAEQQQETTTVRRQDNDDDETMSDISHSHHNGYSNNKDPGERLCVFPMIRNKSDHMNKSSSSFLFSNHHTNNNLLPACFGAASVDSPHDVIVVNPDAFGTHIPNQVTMETAQLVQAVANIESDDWARRFQCHYVLWPSVKKTQHEMNMEAETASKPAAVPQQQQPPLAPLAAAMANDVTRPGSIAHRTIVSTGTGMADSVLFGAVASATVAQVLAMPAVTHTNDSTNDSNNYNGSLDVILCNYGLFGLVAHNLLSQTTAAAHSQQQNGQSSTRPVVTMSILEVNNEHDLYDLLSAKPFDARNKVQLRHSAAAGTDGISNPASSSSLVLLGLADVIVTDVKQVGRCVRRALAAANHPKRSVACGHILATLKVWNSTTTSSVEGSDEQAMLSAATTSNNKCTMVKFLQLAQPLSVSSTTTTTNGSTGITIRHNAFVRQSLTALGSILRGTLLKEAGNDNTMVSSFRDSMLTQVLQRSIEHVDGRVVVLANISPWAKHYDETLSTCRFASRLLFSAGQGVMHSPLVTSGRKQLSGNWKRSREAAVNGSDAAVIGPLVEVSSATFDDTASDDSSTGLDHLTQYAEQAALLQNLLSDPRQRLAKLLKPSKKKVDDEMSGATTNTTHIPTSYEYTMGEEQESHSVFNELPTPQVRNGGNIVQPSEYDFEAFAAPASESKQPCSLITTFSLDAVEEGKESFAYDEPSPLTTDTGYSFSQHDRTLEPIAEMSGVDELPFVPDKEDGVVPQGRNEKRFGKDHAAVSILGWDDQPDTTVQTDDKGNNHLSDEILGSTSRGGNFSADNSFTKKMDALDMELNSKVLDRSNPLVIIDEMDQMRVTELESQENIRQENGNDVSGLRRQTPSPNVLSRSSFSLDRWKSELAKPQTTGDTEEASEQYRVEFEHQDIGRNSLAPHSHVNGKQNFGQCEEIGKQAEHKPECPRSPWEEPVANSAPSSHLACASSVSQLKMAKSDMLTSAMGAHEHEYQEGTVCEYCSSGERGENQFTQPQHGQHLPQSERQTIDLNASEVASGTVSYFDLAAERDKAVHDLQLLRQETFIELERYRFELLQKETQLAEVLTREELHPDIGCCQVTQLDLRFKDDANTSQDSLAQAGCDMVEHEGQLQTLHMALTDCKAQLEPLRYQLQLEQNDTTDCRQMLLEKDEEIRRVVAAMDNLEHNLQMSQTDESKALMSDVEAACRAAADAQRALEELQQQHILSQNEKDEEINRLRSALESLHVQGKREQKDNGTKLATECEEAREMARKWKLAAAEAETMLEQLAGTLEMRETRIKLLSEELEENKTEHASVRQESDDEIERLATKLQRNEATIDELRSELKLARSESAQLVAEKNCATQRTEQLLQEYEMATTEHNQNVTLMEAELDDLKASCARRQTESQQSVTEAMSEALIELEQSEKSAAKASIEYQQKIDKLQRELDQKDEQICDLRSVVEAHKLETEHIHEESMQELIGCRNKAQQDLNEMQELLESHSKSRHDAEQATQAAREALAKSEADRMEAIKIAEEAEGVLAELETRIAQLEEQLETQSARSDELEMIRDALEKELGENKFEIDALKREVDDLRTKLRDSLERDTHFSSANDRMKEEIAELQAKLQPQDSLTRELEQLRDEKRALQYEVQVLEEAVDTSKTAIRLHEAEAAIEMERLRDDCNRLETALSKTIESHENVISMHEHELSLAKHKLEESEGRYAEVDDDLQFEMESKTALLADLEQTQNDLALRIADVKELSLSLQALLTEKEQCEAQVSSMKKAITKFQDETRTKLQKVVQQRSEAASLLEKTLSENEELLAANESLQFALDESRNKLEAVSNEMADTRDELATVRNECHGAIVENTELKACVKELEAHIHGIDMARTDDKSYSPKEPRRSPLQRNSAIGDHVENSRQSEQRNRSSRRPDDDRLVQTERQQGLATPSKRYRPLDYDNARMDTPHDNTDYASRADDIAAYVALSAKKAVEQKNRELRELQRQLADVSDDEKNDEITRLRRRVRALERQLDRESIDMTSPRPEANKDAEIEALKRRVRLLERKLDTDSNRSQR